MALVNCPKCGSSISEKAISCPNCGEIINTEKKSETTIVCSECGKEIDANTSICPFCGFPINSKNKENVIDTIHSKMTKISFKDKKVQIVSIICVVLVLIVGFSVIMGGSLSKNEKHAVKIVKELQSIMKDPDSFKLRDDVIVVLDENYTYYTFIVYSANNSYGASLTGLAMYKDSTYVGDYYDDEDDFDTEEEIKEYKIAKARLAGWRLGGASDWHSAEAVSRKKIAKRLHIDYVK